MSDVMPFTFADDKPAELITEDEPWQLLIVDDDEEVHKITKIVLKSLKFKNREISFVSAYSAKEAIKILQEHEQFAVILLDIVMETSDAGLTVAKFIRDNLHDDIIRIIIRTGQHGDIPEKEIAESYDVNDYKSKSELTVDKLFSTIRTALTQYDQISELALLNEELEKRVDIAVAKQKEQQEALFLQNRSAQMGELLNMLAHQWRQPLSRISAVTTQLKLSLALGEINAEEFDQQLDGVENYVEELSNTINEFRTVYEPSQTSEDVALGELLEKSISLIKHSFLEHNIQTDLICDSKEKDTPVLSEAYQVILSLLKNSQEAFLNKQINNPHINITVLREEERLNIYVEDNAGGIDEEHLEQIFDPYFSTKKEKNGQGLGLYMSKNIIEQHCQGTLSVTNTDNGACFKISLPNK